MMSDSTRRLPQAPNDRALLGMAILSAALLCLTVAFACLVPAHALAASGLDGNALAEARMLTARAKPGGCKLIFVGDSYSYAREDGIVAWPYLVAGDLGIAHNRYALVRHPGYAFARQGHRFISLLERRKRDRSVTHVLIMGGVGNDYRTTCSESIRHYKKTIALIKKKYPNATIMHAVTSWRLNDKKYQTAITQRIPVFRKAAKTCHVKYLKGGENIMKDHPAWFLPDSIHPNQKGHQAIAKFVAKRLRDVL